MDALAPFSVKTRAWFERAFAGPTPAQAAGWPAIATGYPHDWIRTLGKRIVKLHFKDFKFQRRLAEFTNLLEGEIDFKAVHAALADIGYQGSATVELNGGDTPYLKDVNTRFEKILSGA